MFKKGKSGNPNGRPLGTSHAGKLRKAIEKDIPEIIHALANKAKDGDVGAAKLLLDRVIPRLKPKGEPVSLKIGASMTLSEQGEVILDALSKGCISPDDAKTLFSALSSQARVVEFTDLEKRISELEQFNEKF